MANQSVINLVIIIACPAISKGIFFKDSKLNMVNSVVTIPPGSIDKPPINPEVVWTKDANIILISKAPSLFIINENANPSNIQEIVPKIVVNIIILKFKKFFK